MSQVMFQRMLGAVAGVGMVALLGVGQAAVRSAPLAATETSSSSTGWQITQQTTTSTSANPPYTITINQPLLKAAGSDADGFNKAVQAIIDAAESDFRKSAADSAGSPASASDYMIMGYELYATDNNLISLRFLTEVYTGGAHPGHVTITLNYDLQSGKALTLADVFAPKANYLSAIAKFATDELKRENRLTFPDGATAKAENYANWNIDHGGLLFTFDEYQVGPYAEGPSEVFIPYTTLGDLINSDFDSRVFSRPSPATQ